METKRLRVFCDKCKVEIPCVLILDKPAHVSIDEFSKIKYQRTSLIGCFLCKDCAEKEEILQYE